MLQRVEGAERGKRVYTWAGALSSGTAPPSQNQAAHLKDAVSPLMAP